MKTGSRLSYPVPKAKVDLQQPTWIPLIIIDYEFMYLFLGSILCFFCFEVENIV